MIFNFKIDSEDNFILDNQDIVLNLADRSSFSFTFWNNMNKMPRWYSLETIDLLYISLAVFAADRLALRYDSKDGWSRMLELHIPVLEIERWESNCELLEKMISFLSGDSYKFYFRKRELTDKEKNHKEKHDKSKQEAKEYEKVCMLSGGLDSFIGAIDILENSKNNVLFISHYGGGKGTKEYQDILIKELIYKYNLEERDFHQYYAKVAKGIEDTTRTRSFMFFSHAVAVASSLGKHIELLIPENGLISLNIPITYSRLGTSSTRTTHPYYFKLFQELLNNLEIPVVLKNPYQFYTKGEMIINCKNQKLLQDNLNNTMSCSHPDNGRMLGEKQTKHCGYCWPCVIRQAAIKKANINDESLYRDSKFNIDGISKISFNSYRLGMVQFNSKYAFMAIQKSGPISENIDLFCQLYIRGMQEVKNYLEDIK
ncbi:Qat anti-phage system QueC-like protein QatC [Tissierella praeacuta]|uniref:Qat anti-phage system QueC-like protein QatC n=1 Tax=Tissierella praeacuta TaxID=43131 RepID=UPI003DA427CE